MISSRRSSPVSSPIKNPKHSYIFPPRRRPSEKERIRSRRQSVEESIFKFLDESTSVDSFKQGLVDNAKAHQQQHHHHQQQPSNVTNEKTRSKWKNLLEQSSEVWEKRNYHDAENKMQGSHSASISAHVVNDRRTERGKDQTYQKYATKKSASCFNEMEHKARVEVVRDKLNKSIHERLDNVYKDENDVEDQVIMHNIETTQSGNASKGNDKSHLVEGPIQHEQSTSDEISDNNRITNDKFAPNMLHADFGLRNLDKERDIVSKALTKTSVHSSETEQSINSKLSSEQKNNTVKKTHEYNLEDPDPEAGNVLHPRSVSSAERDESIISLESEKVFQEKHHTTNASSREKVEEETEFLKEESIPRNITTSNEMAGRAQYYTNGSSHSYSDNPSLPGSIVIEEGALPSRREQYQEIILDLYELEEECLERLPSNEFYRRQQILIELLRATSEEEAHLTSLTLDDVSEIVAHIQLCLDLDTPLQWTLLENIAFPLGLEIEEEESDVSISSGNIVPTPLDEQNAKTSEPIPHKHSSKHKEFRKYVELSDMELEIVLNHINLCDELNEKIRWDLIAEILFPCDPIRQDMLSKQSSYPIGIDTTRRAGKIAVYLESKATKERARAILTLSNHDFEISSHHDWSLLSESVGKDVQEEGYDSFFEESLHSLLECEG